MKTYFEPNELIEMAQRDAETCVNDINKEILDQDFFVEYVSAFTKAFYEYAQTSKDYLTLCREAISKRKAMLEAKEIEKYK